MRLDKALVESGSFPSRARAKEAIEKGDIIVDGKAILSPDHDVDGTERIEIRAVFPWVSRGALKLIAALDAWRVDPTGKVALDLGASTGGFTQVLLERGARKVYAVDVGHGQLHPSLATDPRVVNLEGTDARSLDPAGFPERPSLIVGDLSFISLEHVLPTIALLSPHASDIVLLVKPQFEVGKGGVKKGIVRDEEARTRALDAVIVSAEKAGLKLLDRMDSPIEGGSGNKEYLIHLFAGGQ